MAKRLTGSCPPELGVEIAVTGSVALGIADSHSDIEVRLWTDRLPPAEARRNWAEACGGREIAMDEHSLERDGSVWLTCMFEGVWTELGWGPIDQFEELLRTISRGATTDVRDLSMAWTVETALPLRTVGLLERWRSGLVYPDGLAEAIIRSQTAAWSDPHVPFVRWALADRGQLFSLSLRLSWDVGNALRVLWAVNKAWDRDWKWTDGADMNLSRKPVNLHDRLNRIFVLANPHESVATCFTLVEDVLELVPEGTDVSRALANIRAARERPAARRDAAVVHQEGRSD